MFQVDLLQSEGGNVGSSLKHCEACCCGQKFTFTHLGIECHGNFGVFNNFVELFFFQEDHTTHIFNELMTLKYSKIHSEGSNFKIIGSKHLYISTRYLRERQLVRLFKKYPGTTKTQACLELETTGTPASLSTAKQALHHHGPRRGW